MGISVCTFEHEGCRNKTDHICAGTYCMFNGVVHDDVVFPHWQPGAKRDDISVTERIWTFPYCQRQRRACKKKKMRSKLMWLCMHCSARLYKSSVEHTWIVTNICIDCKFSDIEGLDDIGVPFFSVFNVMENIIHSLGGHVLTDHPALYQKERERRCQAKGTHWLIDMQYWISCNLFWKMRHCNQFIRVLCVVGCFRQSLWGK